MDQAETQYGPTPSEVTTTEEAGRDSVTGVATVTPSPVLGDDKWSSEENWAWEKIRDGEEANSNIKLAEYADPREGVA